MAAMNAAKPLDFSSFPSVLLFATLLRLALNVASTRVVLVHGHEGEAAAGKVIEAFGAFLIGGNFAVGLFVFMILMIINLVVVTKGAGRVSEVSARFTLDALARQADGDRRRSRRRAADRRRSQGPPPRSGDRGRFLRLDGRLPRKFVKGDAVAALLILGGQHHRRLLPRHDQPRPDRRRGGAALYHAGGRRCAGRAGALAAAVDRRRRDRHPRRPTAATWPARSAASSPIRAPGCRWR